VRPEVDVEGDDWLEPEGADEASRAAISVSGPVNVGRIGDGDGDTDEDAEPDMSKQSTC
jgi:hypothetical protein